MPELLKGVRDDTSYGLASFFKQGFWNASSPQKKQEWLHVMRYVDPHIKSYYPRNAFMPEELPSNSLSIIKENIIPAVSATVLARKQFIVHVKAIVGSEHAKANGFVDFVPRLMDRRFRISSNRSRLHYAIINTSNPSAFSLYAPNDMTPREVYGSDVLIAHHRRDTLVKLLNNYASYKQRGILTFVFLSEHFLVYHMP
jgi:hypothetical protein